MRHHKTPAEHARWATTLTNAAVRVFAGSGPPSVGGAAIQLTAFLAPALLALPFTALAFCSVITR